VGQDHMCFGHMVLGDEHQVAVTMCFGHGRFVMGGMFIPLLKRGHRYDGCITNYPKV
jgi:hypothetical protein